MHAGAELPGDMLRKFHLQSDHQSDLSIQREAESTGVVTPEEAVQRRALPSEQAVQDRLQQENRKLKQQERTKQVNRNTHKSGTKKARQKRQGTEL